MTENVELYSYPVRKQLEEGDIEVYHEIKQDVIPENAETSCSSKVKHETDPVDSYDFFTKQEAKSTLKSGEKKKKGKRKEKSPNLMDIVNSELASMKVPISENFIEIVEEGIHFRDCIDCSSRDFRVIQRSRSYYDLKHRCQYSRTIHLNPVFPDILELTSMESLYTGPGEYVKPAIFDDLITDFGNTDEECSTKFLDVELKNIKFIHHHKFSLENVLSVKLNEQYEEYENIHQTLKELVRAIKVSRETKNNLKRNLTKVSPSKKEELRFDPAVRKYTGQLLELKEKHRETLKEQQAVIHRVLSLWSDIEMVRERFQRRDTLYDLYVKKYNLTEDKLEKEWNNLYEVEFTDMLDKLEYEYVSRYIEYKEAKNDQDLDYTTKKKINKPRINIDEDELKAEVERLVNTIILREKTYLKLVKIDKNESEFNESRNDYRFEVYVDSTFVCESEVFKSDDQIFGTLFVESFSIEILPRNETLSLLLFENNEEEAEVKVDLSKVKNNNTNEDFTAVEFQYNSVQRDGNIMNVGSGLTMKEIVAANKVRLKSTNLFKGNLTTKCEVFIKIGWRETINQMEAIKSSMDIGKKLKRLMHGVDKPSIDALTEVIEKVYGKDVKNNQDMINTISKLCKLTVKTDNEFPIDKNNPAYIRLKLLQLRNSVGFTQVGNKRVPIHGSQISTEQLNCLQHTKEKDIDIDYLKTKEVDMDRIELQRLIATRYMQKLNKDVMKTLNEHLMVKTQRDVVREYQNFTLKALFSKQGNTASLAPISNNTRQHLLTDSLNQEQEIQITVLRAFNLLDRNAVGIEDSENETDTIAGFKVRPLRPFVRVSYHSASAQTVIAMGCHPTWNHTLKICTKLNPLSNLHINIYDECKENLAEDTEDQARTVRYRYCSKWLGMAQIPLFTVLSLGALRGTFKITTPPLLFGYEILQNKLSSSLIPEVTQLMKKDTSFITLHITTSLSHLGAFQAYSQPIPSNIEDDYIIKHLNTFVTDYINDFPSRNISLTFIDSAGRNKCVTQFLQSIPMPSREYFPKNPKSCGSAMSKSSGLSRSSSSKSSGRKRDLNIEASGEKESEYSQGSWKGGDNLGKLINTCLRYVALIPCYDVAETHAVTLMGLELLKVLHGTPLDHTILLSSYFLNLGIKSWIAIGLGLPRGRSSYVIIQYDLAARRYVLASDVIRSRGFLRNDGYLWFVCDAVSGERFELRDVGCPMKTVDFMFDSENIWVNVQSSQDCESVVFDLMKSSDWQPVLDNSIFVMKHPIANESSLYTAPSEVESLRQGLEAKIRGKVQKWRSHTKTIWNRYCSGLLRDALLYWEYWSFNPNENKPPFSQKFKQLMVTYKMSGFPLNLPFSSTKSVISAVKSTALHASDDPNVEFGLAVEVYAYPNNVLSVWVFLATISRV